MSENIGDVGQQTEFSLADLAGINTDDVSEVRGFGLPRGVYHFNVKEGKLTLLGNDKKPCAQFTLEVKNVLELGDDAMDRDSLIGKDWNHTMFIDKTDSVKAAESLGRIKAFVADIGAVAKNVSFGDAVVGAQGFEFVAPITKTKDRNDPDKEYTNLKLDKIKPVNQGQSAAA